MTQRDPDVKGKKADKRKSAAKRCVDFIDAHPHTGWFIASLAVLNVLLNLLQLYLLR